MQQDDQECNVFKTVKRIVKTNHKIIAQQWVRIDHGVLAVSDEDKKNSLEKLSLEAS